MKGRMTMVVPAAALAGVVSIMVVAAVAAWAAEASTGVPAERLAALTRGINTAHWFAQTGDYSDKHLQGYIAASDAALMKSLGFRHVRFPFNERTAIDQEKPLVLNPEKMKIFDAALKTLLDHGLAVVVDFHPEDDYKAPLEKDDAAVDRFVALWGALAKHLAVLDPDKVFLEVMNEPVVGNPARWDAIQGKVLAAMRAAAPRHTLIATGCKWSGVNELVEITPVKDPNVVYNFHLYDPHTFTHQEATWGWEMWRHFKNVPYPSSPEAIEKILPGIAHEPAKAPLRQYGQERWNAARIEAVVARAAEWGAKHGVALTCNEFGVFRKAPAADRGRWIQDVRTALEKYHIGWAMWDYSGGFSVALGPPGHRTADPDTVKALGLTMPE
jgi:aryl-phospho-beta-D-glucosidase BglC (GH1 family)